MMREINLENLFASIALMKVTASFMLCGKKEESVLLAVGDGEHSDLCKIKIKSGPSESRFILAVSEYIHKAQNIFMYIYSHIFI